MTIDQDDFTTFMTCFADRGSLGSNSDLGDMLAAQFGELEWASQPDRRDQYLEVMSRRLAAEPDCTRLEYELAGYCAAVRAEPGGAAADSLVDWLAREMRERQWQRYSIAEHDANAGARYRYDYSAGVYQWEDPRAAGNWLTEAEFSALNVGGAVPDAARYSAPEFDDNYRMWYRYDYSAKTYQWAQSARDARPEPDAVWMTQAEAEQRLHAAAQAQTPEPQPVQDPVPEQVAARFDEIVDQAGSGAVRDVRERLHIGEDELSDEEIVAFMQEAILSGMAQAGLTPA